MSNSLENQEYRESFRDAAIPARFRVPNEAEHPLFVQADFGLVREPDGTLEPKLVEIQGFPSLYAFQPALAEVYRRVYRLDPNLQTFLGGLDEDSYMELLRRAILGGHAPENVVLLEIDPYEQKTLGGFPADAQAARHQDRLDNRYKETGPEALFRGHRGQAHLQPRHCG